ncbi:hypothetical protein F5888DRAFT_538934 [Russula emetica]|nr:hypothetical protein F5888DRAFT_538934 [Russula emetica]
MCGRARILLAGVRVSHSSPLLCNLPQASDGHVVWGRRDNICWVKQLSVYKQMHFGLMLREPKYLGLNYCTRLLPRWLSIAYYVVRKHSPCDLRCVAAGTAPCQVLIQPIHAGTGINTASGTFLFGFLSCGNDQMLFAPHSCARSLGKKAMIRRKLTPFYIILTLAIHLTTMIVKPKT